MTSPRKAEISFTISGVIFFLFFLSLLRQGFELVKRAEGYSKCYSNWSFFFCTLSVVLLQFDVVKFHMHWTVWCHCSVFVNNSSWHTCVTWSAEFQKVSPFWALHFARVLETLMIHTWNRRHSVVLPWNFPQRTKEKSETTCTDLNQVCNLGAGGNFQQV